TSAATAQAARFCAQILAERPGLWPETVRALMVHSADWTPAMRAQLADCRNKRACRDLVRQFGYGVPDVRRAIASAQNDLALIAEARIQPFKREHVERRGRLHLNAPTFNEAHFYQLPWPRSTLEALDMDVRLKVTLSYFVEPSPSAQAPLTPAHYRSFGLRFAMKKPGESASAFRSRVNRFAEVDGDEPVAADRKSTRLNSSHVKISYAVFCLKKKISSTSSGPKLHTLPLSPTENLMTMKTTPPWNLPTTYVIDRRG